MKSFIKTLLRKTLNEVYFLGHSTDRIKERLNVFSDVDFPIGVKREVNKNLSLLDGYDFPKDKSYGVMLGNFNPNPESPYYVEVEKGRGYYRLQDDKIIHDSTGDQFWVVIRNNEATTFMLRKAIQTQDPEHNKEKLRVDDVIKNLERFISQRQQVSSPNMDKFKKIDLTNGSKVRFYFNANKFATLEGQPLKVDDIFDDLTPEMQELVFDSMNESIRGKLREGLLKESFVTQSQLNKLETELDNLFSSVGVDIEFTRHFFERVNDERNGRDITIDELRMIFKEVYSEYKSRLRKFGNGFEGVFKNPPTAINIPFILQWDDRNEELDLVTKTIMRKKNFMSDTPILPVGSNKPQVQLREKFSKIPLANGQKVRYYPESNKFETLDGQAINTDDIFDSLTPEMQEKVFNQLEA